MSNSEVEHTENMRKMHTCVKKLLPWESRVQNRKLACYMLECLGTINVSRSRGCTPECFCPRLPHSAVFLIYKLVGLSFLVKPRFFRINIIILC